MNQCTEKWFPGRGTIEEFSNNTKFLIILVLGPTPFFTKQMCWREAIVGAVRRLGFKSQICVLLYGSCCSVVQLCLPPCNPMDCKMPGFPILHYLPELAQTQVHWVGDDAIQPFHPLSFPSTPAFNLSQHQSLFQWVSSSHQVAKASELQLQHQSFQWVFRIDFL